MTAKSAGRGKSGHIIYAPGLDWGRWAKYYDRTEAVADAGTA